jgi:hypothetical protein
MENDTFDILLLVGRPASGKSEIIDYLKRSNPDERRLRFHIGELEVLDDFPMLWTWFEEDHILSREFGEPRLHSDEYGYFIYPYLWHLLIRRLGLEYTKRLRDDPDYHQHTTALIEFARGTEHGGYRGAFQHLTAEILQRAAIVYVSVSFEESLRKNRRRFNPDRPDSILEHGLEDEKLARLYRHDDWAELAPARRGTIEIQGRSVPYAVFENEDDVTTGRGEALGERLEETLAQLWEVKQAA